MNIDVEGMDLKVIQSNDWKIFKPEIILVEILDVRLEDIKMNPVYKFLLAKDYELIANTLNTYFFRNRNI